MDVLKRAAVLEDALQYRLFLLHPEPLDAQEKQRLLLRLLEDVLAELAALLVGYIWQRQPFNLSFHPEKGGVPAHLGGSTEFGDNVEDEWFIVYLLKHITHTFSELAASVQDNDGQFLLIEAAEYLPKWLDPDSSENRVFLYHGELHILPNRVRAGEAGWPRDSVPSVREALEVTFTRCLYAQLQQQSFVPDRRSGFTLPPPSHPQYRAHELGMKLAHGFEILCSKSGRSATNSEAPVNANPLWRGFLDSLKRNDYFKGELEGSARHRELATAAESFFTQSIPSAQSCAHGPGEEVLQVLESAPYSLEELKKQEAHLPPEDSDDWLNITPDELERLLEERGGQRSSKGRGVACGAGRSEDEEKQQEEEAGYTLVAVTQGMKDFIHAMSSHEGAEFPRSCLSEPFSFDPDAVTSALDRLLGGKDEELDSDDLDDDDDDDDDDNDEEEEAEEEGSEEQTGAETLDNLRRYMDEMDQELQTTNVGQSFTYNSKQDGDMREDAAGSSAQTEDDLQPLDVDVNLVTNLLESLSSQAGLAGPASNLLHSLGLRLPPNADPS
ncbi:hypothetical protein PDJAM_G00013480 [Pangasius djambal]|uniref:Uncharacterized protein n=1 Tax=Pangasius djambal TaxID=1691987 RepID=A0ACC5YLC2_9TELE|nr:hypothetical protein [Pangasius djambal]